MNRLSRLRPSPALVVALAALVAAMSGAAIALPGKNTVKKNDIAPGAVTGKKIAESAIKSKHIKGKSIKGNRLKDKAIKAKQIADKAVGAKQIADDTITSGQVAADGLNTSDLSDVKVFAVGPVAATGGADADAARTAAPRQQLFKKGQLTIYGKCYADPGVDEVRADVFIETSADGAIVNGVDELWGNPFLNVGTAEVDREIDTTNAAANGAESNVRLFQAMSPDGTKLTGRIATAAKHGSLPGGNGIYGAGDVCLFSGEVSG